MTDLATTADLTARLGRDLTDDEAARAPALLTDASGLVRDFTRQDFTQVSGDTIILRPIGSLLRLPQRPVTAVTSVAAVAPDGTSASTMTGWSWDGRDKIDLTWGEFHPDWSSAAWSDRAFPDTYQVVYDHGYATIPDTVVATVCAMVLRTLLSPSMTPGMVAERIGAYNYQLQQGGGAAGASVVMTDADEKAVRRYGPRRAGTIGVEAG